MTHDLQLVGNDYQWLLTIFYITYIVFEFQALMWKIVPPQYVFSETKFSSGLDPVSGDLSRQWWLLQTCFMARGPFFVFHNADFNPFNSIWLAFTVYVPSN